MKKYIIISFIVISLILFFVFINKDNKIILFLASINKDNTMSYSETIECLHDSGVVIYGSKYCPACIALVDSFGGYDKISPIYVDCNEDNERCLAEMKTDYIPEIQIKGVLYVGERNPVSIFKKTNCFY
jgi:hypothetical protein